MPTRIRISLAAVAALLVFSGCSGGESDDCPDDQEKHPISGECEPTSRPRQASDTGRSDSNGGGNDGDTDTPRDTASPAETEPTPDTSGDTGGVDDTDRPDDTGRPDDGGGTDVPGCRDDDGDGFAAEACGGRDCDDSNPGTHPDAPEICDSVDNDCDGSVNEDVDCTFYAHTPSELYKIDPFAKNATKVSTTNAPSRDFFDMDTHPDGTLYTLAGPNLWKLDGSNRWASVGRTGGLTIGSPNGLAIDRGGTGFMTSGNDLFEVNVTTADVQKVGTMGSYRSSGDCVIGKKGVLMMTATGGTGQPDVLVEIDSRDASATKLGATNHDEIWGLTAAWGKLYGVTSDGTLVEIDPKNGDSTTISSFQGLSFYGAASTPASRR